MENEDPILKAIQAELDKQMEEANSRPVEEMDNLSPNDMFQILNFTFGDASPVGFKKTISEATLDAIPFLKLFHEYLQIIEDAKELKLTTRGNLPRKVCLDLYGKKIIPEDSIESGLVKLSKEGDSAVLQNLKILGDLTGITKKRNNKLSLTKKGEKLFQPDQKESLFKELFITNCKKFNLGYYDGYPQKAGVQKTFGYTLYLLLKYGDKKRSLNFYSQKNLTAFPFELNFFDDRWGTPERKYENCLGIRIFGRFLKFYGLVDYEYKFSFGNDQTYIQVPPLFHEVFEIRPDKFKFKKNKHFA